MEKINEKISQLAHLRKSIMMVEIELDSAIHDKFLEVNKISEDSQFVLNGKTIGKTFVKDGEIKGNFVKKDGELSTSFINIPVDKSYKLLR